MGVGDTLDRYDPVDITNELGLGVGETISQMAAGNGHSVVLTSDSRVLAWGNNDSGQLGIGNTINQLLPVDITSYLTFGIGDYPVAIYAGSHNTFIITLDGYLYAFGRNLHGSLGDGTTTDRDTATDVTSGWGLEIGDFPKFVVPAKDFTFLVTTENRVYSVGNNYEGQLGDNSLTNRTSPVDISSNLE